MRRSAILTMVLVVGCASSPTDAGVVGQWGSTQASLTLQRSGGAVSYQCGAGTVDSSWTVSSDGQWLATGQHFFGGGPEPPQGRSPHPARYVGQVTGYRLDFTVTLTDLGQTLGPFHLIRGGPTVTELCL